MGVSCWVVFALRSGTSLATGGGSDGGLVVGGRWMLYREPLKLSSSVALVLLLQLASMSVRQGGIFLGIWGYNLPRNNEGSHEMI